MNLIYDIHHKDKHEAEFNFLERGKWCQQNCKGYFEIGVHSAHFELEEDYRYYGTCWIIEGFVT